MIKKILLVFVFGLLIQFILGGIVIYQAGINQTKQYIAQVSQRIQEDILYKNGKWDTYYYNSDPQVPEDAHPVYVITNDGFVIDRWKPVKGFLDTSDFQHLLAFTTPQTINTVANQNWRIYAKPVISGGKTIGVIVVSSFNPSASDISDLDPVLKQNAEIIASKLQVQGNTITANKFDVRSIPFDLSFQVVNNFNKIIIKNNNYNSIDRLPNFIDPSYVDDALKASQIQIVQDADTGEQYLIQTSKLSFGNNVPGGIILVGKSIQYIYTILLYYLLAGLIGEVIIFLGIYIIIREIRFSSTTYKNPDTVKVIKFFKKESQLRIDDAIIDIPYATNQYYLCDAIFSAPQKRWETDELLKKFGEEEKFQNARKVYDAMILFNKRIAPLLGERIILIKDKTYYLNPKFLPKVTQL